MYPRTHVLLHICSKHYKLNAVTYFYHSMKANMLIWYMVICPFLLQHSPTDRALWLWRMFPLLKRNARNLLAISLKMQIVPPQSYFSLENQPLSLACSVCTLWPYAHPGSPIIKPEPIRFNWEFEWESNSVWYTSLERKLWRAGKAIFIFLPCKPAAGNS